MEPLKGGEVASTSNLQVVTEASSSSPKPSNPQAITKQPADLVLTTPTYKQAKGKEKIDYVATDTGRTGQTKTCKAIPAKVISVPSAKPTSVIIEKNSSTNQAWKWVRKDSLQNMTELGQIWVPKVRRTQPHQQQQKQVRKERIPNKPQTKKYVWVRKDSTTVVNRSVIGATKRKAAQNNTKQRWIRKDLLNAQKIQHWIWVPKPKNKKNEQVQAIQLRRRRTTKTTTDNLMQGSPIQKRKQVWLRKSQVYHIGDELAWIPKQVQTKTATKSSGTNSCKAEKEIVKASCSSTKKMWVPKIKPLQVREQETTLSPEEPSASMRFRALRLQRSLFGWSSMLLPGQNWKEFVRKQQGYNKLPNQPWIEMVRSKQGYKPLPHQDKQTFKAIQVS